MKRNIYYGQGYCIDGKNVPSYSEYVNICQKAKCKPSEEEQGNGDVITLWNYPCVDVKVPSQKIAFASEPGAVLYEGHYLTNEATFNSKTGKCTRFIVDRPETSFLYIRNYEPETEDSDYIRVGLWSIGISNIDDYFVGIYEGESGSYLELCDNGEFYYENEHMYDAGRWSYEGGMLCFTNEYYAKTYTSLEFMLCRIDGEGNEEEVEGMFRVTE